MMNVTYKWELRPGSNAFQMPANAKILTVQVQNDVPQLWALLDPNEPKVLRTFGIYATGQSVPYNFESYVGSFQLEDGKLVFHLFETTGA